MAEQALQCPLLLPTDLARLLHDTGIGTSGVEGFSGLPSSGFLAPGLGLAGALLQPGYVTEGDTLAFRVYSSLDYVTCYLRAQLLLSSGRVVYWGADLKPKGDVTRAQYLSPMPECLIRTAAMSVVSNDKDLPYIPPGTVYGRVDLSRADDSQNVPYATLVAGYLSSRYAPTYPTSPVQDSAEGVGHIKSLSLDPYDARNAGGFDFGPSRRIRPLYAQFGLTTSAVVANRFPGLYFGNQWGGIFHAQAPVPQVASTAQVYVFARGSYYGGPTGSPRVMIPLPCCDSFGQSPSAATNVGSSCQLGDIIGGCQLVYEEWLEPEWNFE